MKSNFNSRVSKKEAVRLAELRLQKEKILKDMQIHEERKKRKITTIVHKAVDTVNINLVKEPLMENKPKLFPKHQNKSFSEIMQEANEKEMLKKRQSLLSSQVPTKKQKLSLDNKLRNNNDPSLKKGTCVEKAAPIKASERCIITQTLSHKQQSSNVTKNQSKVAPRGIMAQNSMIGNKGIISQNGVTQDKISTKSRHEPSSSFIARGIQAQNRMAVAQYLSGSEEEQDSDLDSFIDDTEKQLPDTVRKEIYESLRFDPSKYQKVSFYDDCKNMESSTKQIEVEESKSMKLAKVEDLKEAKLEMERLKKKGKL